MNAPSTPNSYRNGPDENGRFGLFGSKRGFSPSDIASAAAGGIVDAAEERALWARFGL